MSVATGEDVVVDDEDEERATHEHGARCVNARHAHQQRHERHEQHAKVEYR